MNTQKATKLGQSVFELMILTARSEGLYRRGKPTHDSPDDAWKLAEQIDKKQGEIFKQLEPSAVAEDHSNQTTAWQRFNDCMDTTLVANMLRAIGNLVVFCTQLEADPTGVSVTSNERMIEIMQYAISRMLDPKVVHEYSPKH